MGLDTGGRRGGAAPQVVDDLGEILQRYVSDDGSCPFAIARSSPLNNGNGGR
jgi:hypothetical protein